MRKTLTFFVLLIISCLTKVSAQTISYIIPDIGAPGMNIYLEIISPHNANGNFGTDGFYLNNPGDAVHIELVNKEDAAKVVFGPLIVSWNGRMISTQVFVMPGLTPNSDRWDLLQDQYKIPFQVRVNGNLSTVETFYIVKPLHLGNIVGLSNATIFGTGNLGIRSRRGAMIVDSLILDQINYGVSRNDCDPISDGNQGYLPFILLSKGDIKGRANSFISVNGAVRDGGPGGGGGGGNFCDAVLGSTIIGENGGNGYTGGGAGGRNNTFASTPEYKSVGVGSGGVDGKSLNGVTAPQNLAYESSGGGTGHPFGSSGVSCSDGVNCDGWGENGGGTGYRNNQSGGSGGYGTDGSSTGTHNGGKTHGNTMLIPFAGGSGGASGNPNQAQTCSGSGGGGGGAAVIFGRTLDSIHILAYGGNGDIQTNGGGGGSGGAGAVYSKLPSKSVSVNIDGGAGGISSKGGIGRARIDAPSTTLGMTPAGSFSYTGITTDTTSFVKRDFVLTGSKQNSSSIKIYIKPQTGAWYQDTVINLASAAWQAPISLTTMDSIYFVCVVQNVQNPSTQDYKYEPVGVMSQAAANILRILKAPKITGDTVRNLKAVNCPGTVVYDTAKIYNKGDAPLVIDFDKYSFVYKNRGYSLVSPTVSYSVPPLDSVSVIVKYSYINGQTGVIRDTLQLPHNDLQSLRKPWKIAYNTTLDTIKLLNYTPIVNDLFDTTGFYKFCINSVSTRSFFYIKNLSTIGVTLTSASLSDNINFKADIVGKRNLANTGDTSLVVVTFTPSAPGVYASKLVFKVNECDSYADTVYLKGEAINTILTATPASGTFKDTKIGQRDTLQISIKNSGNGNAFIKSLPVINPPFRIISSVPSVPDTLKPGENLVLNIEFAPTSLGDFSDSLHISSLEVYGSCPDSVLVTLNGKSTSTKLYQSATSIDFGLQPPCGMKQDSVVIKNIGTASFVLTEDPIITGVDKQNFGFVQYPSMPDTLKPNQSAVFYIKFIPAQGPDGPKNAVLEIKTDEPNNPVVKVDLTGIRESLKVSLSQSALSFGDVAVGQSKGIPVTLTNIGTLKAVVSGIVSYNPEVTVLPQTFVINPNGGTSIITATLTPTTKGSKKAKIKIIFTSPCPDSMFIDADGKGIEGAISFNDSLNFGILAPCKDSIDNVIITNVGDGAPVTLTKLKIGGNDSALFTLLNPIAGNDTILQMGEKYIARIRFNPQGTPDGTKTADLQITLIINGDTVVSKAKLIGEKESGIITIPGTIDFGKVVQFSTVDKILVLKNIGKQPVKIAKLVLPVLNVFKIEPAAMDTTLKPGDSIVLKAKFTPDTVKYYEDSLKIALSVDGCPDMLKVVLKGSGSPSKGIIVWLPKDTLVTPDIDNFFLPVYIKIDTNKADTLINSGFETEITFNASMFLPYSLTKGVILKDSLYNGNRIIKIRVDSVMVTDKSSIATEIRGSTLLGDDDTTKLTFSNFDWLVKGTAGNIQVQDGLLRTRICRKGGDRLLKSGLPLSLSVKPNPAHDIVNIDVDVLETGEHKLQITNALGLTTSLMDWSVKAEGDHSFSFNFNTSDLSSGLYYIILNSPTDRKIVPLIIEK